MVGAFVLPASSLPIARRLVSQVRSPVSLAVLALLTLPALLTLLATVAPSGLVALLFAAALGATALSAPSLLALSATLAACRRAGTAAGMPALGTRQPLGGSPRRSVAAGLVSLIAAGAGLLWLSSPLAPTVALSPLLAALALLASAADLAAADRLRRALLAPRSVLSLALLLAVLTVLTLSSLPLLAPGLSSLRSWTLVLPTLLAELPLLALLAGGAPLATTPGVLSAFALLTTVLPARRLAMLAALLTTVLAAGRSPSALLGGGPARLLAPATLLGPLTALLVTLPLGTTLPLVTVLALGGLVATAGGLATTLGGLALPGRLPLLPARRLAVLARPADALGSVALVAFRRLLA